MYPGKLNRGLLQRKRNNAWRGRNHLRIPVRRRPRRRDGALQSFVVRRISSSGHEIVIEFLNVDELIGGAARLADITQRLREELVL